jgi:hypothetical protein
MDTSCAICFTKFPGFRSNIFKIQNNPDVLIYAVNVPLRNDNLMKQQLFKKLGYILSKIYATSAKQVEDSLKINAPTLTNYKKWKIRV